MKINAIYEAVRDSVPWDVTCVRTKHTVSIHCKQNTFSLRSTLFTLHIQLNTHTVPYKLCCDYTAHPQRFWPASTLTLLAVPMMVYSTHCRHSALAHCLTGTRVWANPRAIVAMMRQCNTVDMSRRSPSYEVRLAKYSGRAFEVYVPTLKREDIDPTVSQLIIAPLSSPMSLLFLAS